MLLFYANDILLGNLAEPELGFAFVCLSSFKASHNADFLSAGRFETMILYDTFDDGFIAFKWLLIAVKCDSLRLRRC